MFKSRIFSSRTPKYATSIRYKELVKLWFEVLKDISQLRKVVANEIFSLCFRRCWDFESNHRNHWLSLDTGCRSLRIPWSKGRTKSWSYCHVVYMVFPERHKTYHPSDMSIYVYLDSENSCNFYHRRRNDKAYSF